MQKGTEQLEVYQSIIQNLLALKEEAIETKPKEAEAIEAILHTLSALRDCWHYPNLLQVSSITQVDDADVILGIGCESIAVHA